MGGELEEDGDIKEGRSLYREALRRGSKRLTYRSKVDPEDLEELEEEVRPKVKRARGAGELGHGWEHITPERSPDPGGNKDLQHYNPGKVKPQRFSDIVNKKEQDLVSLFAKSVDDGERDITSRRNPPKDTGSQPPYV